MEVVGGNQAPDSKVLGEAHRKSDIAEGAPRNRR